MYIVRGDDHICLSCFMPIHGHCTLMYPGLLCVCAVVCRVVLLYYVDWVAGLPFLYLHHFTSGMDFIMYFGHRITPLISYIRGHLL